MNSLCIYNNQRGSTFMRLIYCFLGIHPALTTSIPMSNNRIINQNREINQLIIAPRAHKTHIAEYASARSALIRENYFSRSVSEEQVEAATRINQFSIFSAATATGALFAYANPASTHQAFLMPRRGWLLCHYTLGCSQQRATLTNNQREQRKRASDFPRGMQLLFSGNVKLIGIFIHC